MKIYSKVIVLFLLVFPIFSISQTPITFEDSTIKIPAWEEVFYYYGLKEGDKILFNYELIKGKELKEIEISEYESSTKFIERKTKKIENKIIEITKTGIYKFRFYNSSLGVRVCKIKIQRIPLSDKEKKYNSTVFWKTIKDSIYTPEVESYLEKTEYISNDVYTSNPQISSKNALNGNKNYQIIDFDLPENTKSWSFYIGCGVEGKKEYERAVKNFSEKAIEGFSKYSTYGPMASLALTGVSYFKEVQGKDNVKYWFLPNSENVTAFETGNSFSTYKKGDVINESSKMSIPNQGKVYLAILNDNTIEPIQLTIKVNSIVINEIWKTRTIQVLSVTERQEPYLKN